MSLYEANLQGLMFMNLEEGFIEVDPDTIDRNVGYGMLFNVGERICAEVIETATVQPFRLDQRFGNLAFVGSGLSATQGPINVYSEVECPVFKIARCTNCPINK